MAWTPDTFYSEFCKQLQKCEMGNHNFVHQIDINELRLRYKTLKEKTASNLCYITYDEIIEGMKLAAKDWAEDMAFWLNSPIKVKEDWQDYIEYDFNQKIGQIVGKPKWLNGQYFESEGTVLTIALAKIQLKDGGFTFKIIISYCELSYKDRERL